MYFYQSHIKYLLTTFLFISRVSAILSETDIQQQYVQSTISNNQHQAKYNVPFLLLMSKDQVSVVQCPLIDNGMITVAYSLNKNLDIELENETKEAFSVVEQESLSSSSPSSATSSRPFNADAREYEQMPQSVTQQTTLALGKSEWQQQIASNSNNSKSIAEENTSVTGSSQEVKKSNSKQNEAAEDATAIPIVSSDGNNNERKEIINSPRKRRSNSLADFFFEKDDRSTSNNGFDGTDAQLKKDFFPLSSTLNVTSARFARGTLTTNVQGREEEEEEKNKKKNYPLSSPDEGDKISAVQFSDIDVHMELGYAFVADSVGRIHRFRLSGFEQAPTSNSRIFNSFPGENDNANTIDLPNSKMIQHNYGYSNVESKQNFTTERQKFYHFQAPVEDDIAHGSNNDDDANRVDQNNNTTSYDNVTHEQSGRHPTVSGLESLHNGKSGSVASTLEQTFNVNQVSTTRKHT